jgi:hypothetical protein
VFVFDQLSPNQIRLVRIARAANANERRCLTAVEHDSGAPASANPASTELITHRKTD